MNQLQLRTLLIVGASVSLLILGGAITNGMAKPGVSRLLLMQKPSFGVSLQKPEVKVLAASDHTSAENAAAQATLKAGDWVKNGWSTVGIASTYSMQEVEGTTVTGSPIWTVYVLLNCTPSATNKCLRLSPP